MTIFPRIFPRFISIFLLFYINSFLFQAAAQTTDSALTRVISPGVIHHTYYIPGPNIVNVLEIDLRNPHVKIESYRSKGLVRTTAQAKANDRPGHRVIAAINADFFSFTTGMPITNQVVDGKPVLGMQTMRSQLGIGKKRAIFIDSFSFAGTLIPKKGSPISISHVNTGKKDSLIVFYTSYLRKRIDSIASSVEYSLRLLSPLWITNDTLLFLVTAKSDSMELAAPEDGGIIATAGKKCAEILTRRILPGDTVKIFLGYYPQRSSLEYIIGGYGRLLRNGVNLAALSTDNEGLTAKFTAKKHPRTFVGFNADTTKLFFCTVDGRQAKSTGMTFLEMANFLLSINVTDAFNFDGGGSTTMVIRDRIVNSPSDSAGERPVANTLQLISTAPAGTLCQLNIEETNVVLFPGTSMQFHAEGRDEFGNPTPIPSIIQWNASSHLGAINAEGLLSLTDESKNGWVYLRAGKLADSTYVRITPEK